MDVAVDTSALIAFLDDEPEAARIEAVLADDRPKCMSALNLYECKVVVSRRYHEAMQTELELLLARIDCRIVGFDADFARLAWQVYCTLGKGTGHPAGLNLGDCAAYALATSAGIPLLYVGNDFAETDATPALAFGRSPTEPST